MRSAYAYDARPAVQDRAAPRSPIRGAAKHAGATPENGDTWRRFGIRRLDAVFPNVCEWESTPSTGINPIVNACFRYRVSGRVQGVYFRATTREQALGLGLTGWVRNTPAGAVEILACGEEAKLAALEAWLRRGPAHARVVSVEREPADPEVCRGFEIR
ncbi:MAG: acylphosphatase [Gammaproteobacteria bacterium]